MAELITRYIRDEDNPDKFWKEETSTDGDTIVIRKSPVLLNDLNLKKSRLETIAGLDDAVIGMILGFDKSSKGEQSFSEIVAENLEAVNNIISQCV